MDGCEALPGNLHFCLKPLKEYFIQSSFQLWTNTMQNVTEQARKHGVALHLQEWMIFIFQDFIVMFYTLCYTHEMQHNYTMSLDSGRKTEHPVETHMNMRRTGYFTLKVTWKWNPGPSYREARGLICHRATQPLMADWWHIDQGVSLHKQLWCECIFV